MSIKIENGRKGKIDELKVLKEKLIDSDSIERRQKLCATLGLDVQANFVGESDIEADKFYTELSGYELNILMSYLPRWYSRQEGDWKNYRFDVVPTEVLEEINFALSLQIFDDLEIWTPERINDPMAVGVVGRHGGSRSSGSARFFRISRWGESLRTFKEIEEKILKTRIHNWLSNRPITPKVQEFIDLSVIPKLKEDLGRDFNSRFYIDRCSFFFHCRQRMYKIRYYLKDNGYPGPADFVYRVCPKCGLVRR